MPAVLLYQIPAVQKCWFLRAFVCKSGAVFQPSKGTQFSIWLLAELEKLADGRI